MKIETGKWVELQYELYAYTDGEPEELMMSTPEGEPEKFVYGVDEAVLPVFKDLYESVKSGKETARVLSYCGAPDYQKTLSAELSEIRNSEMWRAGAAVRSLRPHEAAKAVTANTKGVSGRGED